MPIRRNWLELFTRAPAGWLALSLCFTCQAAYPQGLGMPPTSAVRPQTTPHPGSNHRSGTGTNRATTQHRDALGNPCLAVESMARAHVANPKVYDHVLVLDNQCLQSIKTRACYTESDQCVDTDVPGLTRKDVVLGVSSVIKYFSYEFHEF